MFVCVYVRVCMYGKKKGSDGKRNEIGMEEEESSKSRVNTHHTHTSHLLEALISPHCHLGSSSCGL